MDKLKNLVNPGSKKDDEVLYGSGNVDDPVLTGNTNTVPGEGTHFGSSSTTGNNPLSSSTKPTFSTGNDNSIRNDPLTDSTNPTNSAGYDTASRSKPLGTSTNPTGNSQYDTWVNGRGTGGLDGSSSSRMPGGFEDDAATTASISSGVPGHPQPRSGLTGTNDPSSAYAPGPGSGLTGHEYPDRSVRSTGVGDQNYSPETGRSFPLGGSPKNATGSNYPSGQTGTDPTGDTIGTSSRGPHSSSLANKADPRVDSDLDSSRQIGSTGLGSGTGPISSSTHQGTLGRDPALISGTGVEHDMTSGTGTAPQAGIGSGIAAGAALGGAESWEHDHNRHGHRYEGDPCATGEAAPTGALHTHGPHVTDTANRLDPHVAADGTSTSHHHGDHGHHHGDIASTGGLAAASHETSRATSGTVAGTSNGSKFDHSNPGTVGTSSTGKTAGPHKSDLLNKLDPRVDSDLSKQQGRTDTIDRGSDSSSHKYGRDAGLVGAGGAAAFAAEKHHHHSEPQVRNTALDHSYPHSSFGVDPPVGSTSSGYGKTVDFDDTRKDHHLGRDVALGEGAGGTAYAAEHTHAKPTQASTVPGDMAGTVHENTTGQTGSGHHSASAALAGSGHQATTGYAESGHPQTSSHHLGRDATFGAGAGGAAYEADKMINTDRTEPGTQVREHTHPGASIATYPSPGYGNEGAFDPSEGRAHHHRKEDAAIAGGAGVGIGAAADHKFSREDHKDSAKEHNKEQKAIAKEHHREEKALAKEHHNEEKAHEKEQAKHERIIEKEEKKHEKSLEKEAKKEDRSEKKHGGILGLFHRDKGDKNNREDLMQGHASSRAREDGRDLNEQMTTAPRRGPLEGEHGTQSGVHDPPLDTGIGSGVGSGTGIGHGITTHDAYGTQEGQNKLHKDPPAKVLESRGLDQPGTGY